MLLLELLSGFLLELDEAGGNSPSDVRGFISGCFHFYTVLPGHLRHFLYKADLPGTASFPFAPIYGR